MMERKEIVRYVLLILCVFVLFAIPWASVIGIQDPGLLETITTFQRTGAFLVLTGMVATLIYQIYYKPLAQEIKEEEIRVADQKEKKQLLFKPTFGGYGLVLFFILFIGFCIITISLIGHTVDLLIIASIGLMVFFIWTWYKMPVFVFADDSVQIKSHLLYLLGIDQNTIIRYADITSVSPDMKIKGNMYGFDPGYRMLITTNGTTQAYGLGCYNSNIVAKIYLRFQEKLGDKVKLQ